MRSDGILQGACPSLAPKTCGRQIMEYYIYVLHGTVSKRQHFQHSFFIDNVQPPSRDVHIGRLLDKKKLALVSLFLW